MSLLARAVAGATFGADIARAAARGVLANLRAPRDEPEGANEVHFLIEGDPKRGLTPAARYRAVSYVPLLEAAGLRCRVWPSRPDKYFTATARWQSFYARWPRLAMLEAHLGHVRQRRSRRREKGRRSSSRFTTWRSTGSPSCSRRVGCGCTGAASTSRFGRRMPC